LTLLSSTTSSRAPVASCSATGELRERGRDARVFPSRSSSGAPPAARTASRPVVSSAFALAPSAKAPKVCALDLSECAVRRNATVSPPSNAARSAASIVGRVGEERAGELAREVRAGALRELVERRAVDRRVAHLASRAGTWPSASTSRSTRIGLVR
jgi:hypothetical protein